MFDLFDFDKLWAVRTPRTSPFDLPASCKDVMSEISSRKSKDNILTNKEIAVLFDLKSQNETKSHAAVC